MNLLATIKREERKLEKELDKIQHRLAAVRGAAAALGRSTRNQAKRTTKRALSAVARAKISKAAKKRWAKFRAQAKKAAG